MADTEDAIGRVKIGEEISDANFMDGITTMGFSDSLRDSFLTSVPRTRKTKLNQSDILNGRNCECEIINVINHSRCCI